MQQFVSENSERETQEINTRPYSSRADLYPNIPHENAHKMK